MIKGNPRHFVELVASPSILLGNVEEMGGPAEFGPSEFEFQMMENQPSPAERARRTSNRPRSKLRMPSITSSRNAATLLIEGMERRSPRLRAEGYTMLGLTGSRDQEAKGFSSSNSWCRRASWPGSHRHPASLGDRLPHSSW